MRINSIFTEADRPGHGGTGHVHLSNTRQLPSTGRSVIPFYRAAKKTNPQILAENHHFCRVHEQNADFALLTGGRFCRLQTVLKVLPPNQGQITERQVQVISQLTKVSPKRSHER